jgi:hypothetical protein
MADDNIKGVPITNSVRKRAHTNLFLKTLVGVEEMQRMMVRAIAVAKQQG